MSDLLPDSAGYSEVHSKIVHLLDAAKSTAARSVNAVMTATYWEIGRRIVELDQAGQDRAVYGDALIARLAEDLTTRFGRGFSRQNLQQMRSFYFAWPSKAICQTPSGESVDVSALSKALPNKVMAAEYQTILPNEKRLTAEIEKTQQALSAQRLKASGEDA